MSDPLTTLARLDRRLTLARLELVVEALAPFVPGLASAPALAELDQAAVRAWLDAAEHMIAMGIHERYPEHARRHARALARIPVAGPPELDDASELEARVGRYLGRAGGEGGSTGDEDVVDLGDGMRLRKTRPGGERVEDWSALDGLASREEVEPPRPLAHPYRVAIEAYCAGRYEECREALVRCLRQDDAVEEYWSLLAFTERHLGRRDVFERIVFEGVRVWPP